VARLKLPTVTLCAATSVNVEATVAAMRASMDQVDFGEALLFTDVATTKLPRGIRRIAISPLRSGRDYSEFLLGGLAEHVRSDHCLVVQWDGFVIDAVQWDPGFLDHDYIGAPWPQFRDGHDVGNGGFSLRSRRLLEACRSPAFRHAHPEDVAIGRLNRGMLERDHAIRFADRATAERFAFERTVSGSRTFGFHGVFNMIPLLGAERFWALYRTLDDRGTAIADYGLLMRQLGSGKNRSGRRLRLTIDRLKALVPVRRA
jgi:hypothetical protein